MNIYYSVVEIEEEIKKRDNFKSNIEEKMKLGSNTELQDKSCLNSNANINLNDLFFFFLKSNLND